jgi:hypothetical protein
MTVSITITGEDEIDFRRQLMRIATPYLEGFVENESGEFEPYTGEINLPLRESYEPTAEPPPAVAAAPEPKKGGRPRGSTNKPKTNGNGAEPPQTQAQPENGAVVELLSLTEQIQIITDAAHDQPDKFKPLLAPLRDKLGVQYVSKAVEKDRPVLQDFINEHGLAV